jgi:hypothetical protein
MKPSHLNFAGRNTLEINGFSKFLMLQGLLQYVSGLAGECSSDATTDGRRQQAAFWPQWRECTMDCRILRVRGEVLLMFF